MGGAEGVFLDCGTGLTTVRELTADEAEQHRADGEHGLADKAAREALHAARLAVIRARAAADPAYAALAELLGVQLDPAP